MSKVEPISRRSTSPELQRKLEPTPQLIVVLKIGKLDDKVFNISDASFAASLNVQ